MKKNKCTLVVDGNWLLRSRILAIKEYFALGNYQPEAGKTAMFNILAQSICRTLSMFDGVVDNILIVKDGGSWRKKLEKPASLQATVYKGNRVSDETYDWNAIWKVSNDFFDRCKEIGITVSMTWDMEGDDLIYYWTNILNNEGVNCIIWSTDQDLQQLVKYDSKAFTVWYEKSKGLCLPNSLEEKQVDPIDFFMTSERAKNPLIEKLKTRTNSFYIDPAEIVMSKIVCGDTGDNIKSLIRIQKNTKTYRISNKDWLSVKSDLNIDSLDKFFEYKDAICERLRMKKNTGNLDEIKEEFDYNKKLVWLNSETIPNNLLKTTGGEDYYIYDVDNIKNNYRVLTGEADEDSAVAAFEDIVAPVLKKNKYGYSK